MMPSEADWRTLAEIINEIAALPGGEPVAHRLYDHLDDLIAQLMAVEPTKPRTPMQARPTTYKGIAMRSRLEALYAAALDDQGRKWEYEPRAFANERGQYLPDFYLPDEGLYAEVRPTRARAADAPSRMEIIWDSDPDAVLAVWIEEDGQTLRGDPKTRQWSTL